MAGASLVVQEPVGVVAAFPAYNFAFPAVPQKAGPALIAGCTAVVKVTEPNPLATFIYGEICEEIGLPPGVINIVAARGPEAEYLVRHPGRRHGELHRVGADRCPDRRRLRRADQAVRARARRQVRGDRARGREARGRAAGTRRRQRRHQRRPELCRADPSRRAGVAVRRLRRGPRRGLPVTQGRRPDGGRHGRRPAGDRAQRDASRSTSSSPARRAPRSLPVAAGRPASTGAGTSSPPCSPTPTTRCGSRARRSSARSRR